MTLWIGNPQAPPDAKGWKVLSGFLLGCLQAELLAQKRWQSGLFEGIEASQAALRALQEKHDLRPAPR